MQSRLQQELRQNKPFMSPAEEASLSVERTAAVLRHAIAETLRAFDVTVAQYNVLRVLRGAGATGLCRYEVGDRLVTRVPDVTRLLDRMEETGLVVRERSTVDRRLVSTRITDDGLALLERADAPVAALHARQLAHLTDAQLHTLIELLAVVRQGGPPDNAPDGT